MRKFLPFILIIALAFSMTSCGKPKEIKELEELTKALSELDTEEGLEALAELGNEEDMEALNELADSIEDEASSYDFSDIEVGNTPGSELTDFYNSYNNALQTFEESFNNWETDDFSMFDAAMDYYIPSLHFVSMSLYDALYFLGMEDGSYKEVNGDIIEFGKEYIRDEDGFSPSDKEGDVIYEKGILDTSAKTLFFETYTERDGEKLSRSISEVVSLSDGTFITQTLSKNLPYDGSSEDKGSAYFMVFDSNKLEVIKASFAPDVNFTYDSIIGINKATVDDLAQGYTLLRKSTVADGVVSVEKY